MKKYIPLLSLIFISCWSTESNLEEVFEEVAREEAYEDPSYYDEVQSSNEDVFIVRALVEGYDEEFYVHPEDESSKPKDLSTLKVIPEGWKDDLSETYDWMLGIVENDFHFPHSSLSNHTGTVKVYYDQLDENLVCEYEMLNGMPFGNVKVFDLKGNVLIDRTYGEDGKWTSSAKELACVDWTFDQETGNLAINDLKFGEEKTDSSRTIKITGRVHETVLWGNDLYPIMQKESFKNEFKINGFPYTGKLQAYFKLSDPSLDEYFELNFVSGKLDGIINIYDSWGTLTLQEKFTAGDLDTVLYQYEEQYEDGVAKPIIYLYPEKETAINVQLEFKGELTHTYPKYPTGGWNITAAVDGTLDYDGKEFYSLYWEGQNEEPFTISSGSVIKGEETVTFLEEALETLGLNRREANEFIIYWLPMMENNPYNLIHFSTDEYEDMAKLKVTPTPESIIRVMMIFEPLKETKTVPYQDLSKLAKTRSGFTVVEWGGKRVKSKNIF